MRKAKRSNAGVKVIVSLLILALIAGGAFCLWYFVFKVDKNATAYSVEMNLDSATQSVKTSKNVSKTNYVGASTEKPNIQLMINAKDEVIGTVALNLDGEKVLLSANFEGLKVDEACELYAKMSSELGYIEFNTNGTSVDLTIYADSKKINKIKDDAIAKVNNYFKENGIIAKANVIKDELKNALVNLGVELEQAQKLTEEQLKTYLDAKKEELKDVAFERQAQINNAVNTVINGINNKVLESPLISSADKERFKDFTNDFNELMKTKDVDKFVDKYIPKVLQDFVRNSLKYTFKEIENIKTASVEILNGIKVEAQNLINTIKTEYDAHKQAFEENKTEILKQIEDYQKANA